MKGVQEILDRARKHFQPGGKLHRAKPVFDAMDSFAFTPLTRTPQAAHVRDPLDVKRFMSMVIVAVAPCWLAGVYFFGWRVLTLTVVSYAAGGAVEVAVAILRREEINEGFLVTGLLFPLILPPTTPLPMAAVGVMFGVLVGKELFGGTGRNVFNPALVGRCFLVLAYPEATTKFWVRPAEGGWGRLGQYVSVHSADAVTGATPLSLAKKGQVTDVSDLLVGTVAGSAGETCALAVIAGGLLLLATRVANWRTVVGVLATVAVFSALLHWADPLRYRPAHWHLLAGGLMFGAFFMATDPVTSPLTAGGKWIYAVLIGAATVLIRNFTGYVEGVMFAILMGNMFAPVLDEVVVRARLRSLQSES